MKRIIFGFYLTTLLLINATAQTVPNFTVTDVNGTTHNLYSYLEKGMYALLLFSDPSPS